MLNFLQFSIETRAVVTSSRHRRLVTYTFTFYQKYSTRGQPEFLCALLL